MKYWKQFLLFTALLLALTACTDTQNQKHGDATQIILSSSGIQVDGNPIVTNQTSDVYAANDIVYYESGKDFTYGEGTQEDAHSAETAAEHTVIHISTPGTYSISGKLPKGQIAVDLGENAKNDPNAVVTLILNGVDITCEVAPAIIFYNVYECADTENPTKDVNTAAAGANVILADGSQNTVNGSYVARIYKPDTVELNAQKTEVTDAKKLHKYDGAFYSKMSMNVSAENEGTGVLNIYAENEGLDSEMHLTINSGNIHIYSGNDGINTNEDGVSVTTVNGGTLNIQVTGETGEGDGIDSNGWLVINGGTVVAAACANSADAGIDSDMGIHINGGTVIATGHMLDRIEDGGQTYAVFSFAQKQNGADTVFLKNETGKAILENCPQNIYSILIYSSPQLKEGTYTLWSNTQQLAGQSSGMAGGPGMVPGGMMRPENEPPEGEPPFGIMEPPSHIPPEGEVPSDRPGRPQGGNWNPDENIEDTREQSPEFPITPGANMFSGISPIGTK